MVGLVAPVGVDLEFVISSLQEALSEVAYETLVVSLIDAAKDLALTRRQAAAVTSARRFVKRIDAKMTLGTKAREKYRAPDLLAYLAIAAIQKERYQRLRSWDRPAQRVAYILRQIKRPEEARRLRQVYGDRFVLIAVTAPRDQRVKVLADKIAADYSNAQPDRYRSDAEQLLARDEYELVDAATAEGAGQNVRDTFPEADFFLDASDPANLVQALQRFVRLLFNYPVLTPTRDEQGMYFARAAALRSASLARQVGAAVTTSEGDLLVVGTNEVPRPAGGLYWEGDAIDDRNVRRRRDDSDEHRA